MRLGCILTIVVSKLSRDTWDSFSLNAEGLEAHFITTNAPIKFIYR